MLKPVMSQVHVLGQKAVFLQVIEVIYCKTSFLASNRYHITTSLAKLMQTQVGSACEWIHIRIS